MLFERYCFDSYFKTMFIKSKWLFCLFFRRYEMIINWSLITHNKCMIMKLMHLWRLTVKLLPTKQFDSIESVALHEHWDTWKKWITVQHCIKHLTVWKFCCTIRTLGVKESWTNDLCQPVCSLVAWELCSSKIFFVCILN